MHAQLFPFLQHLTTTNTPSQLFKASSFPLGSTGLTQTERLFYNQLISSKPSACALPLTPWLPHPHLY